MADRKALMSSDAAATALRFAGASYVEIADALGYSSAVEARQAVERDLASQASIQDRESLRAEEAGRLMRMLRSVWRKATDETHPEQLPAMRTALAIVDRHARLLGLDQPTEHVVYTPSQREMEEWLAEVLTLRQPHVHAIEADVVEGDDAEE